MAMSRSTGFPGAEPADTLQPGDAVDGFTVLASWRAGSMAALYLVRDATGVECLLKMPRLGFGSHPACFAGFETEQSILQRLVGPHVPMLRASGETAGGPYLVIERVVGRPLSDLADGPPLGATDIARIGAALATALHALHRQDVVHHDLKPAHVILRADGRAVLIDFGLAYHGALPDLAAAESDGPLGTAAYLAPEQVLGRRGDPRSDIFAAGAILYRLATGRLPWGDPTSSFALGLRLRLDPPAPRSLRPDLPDWLQEIVLRCLEGQPGDRYPTAAQLAHDLAHPEQVVITERGRRRGRGGWRRMLARALTRHPQATPVSPAEHLSAAPHILVALDTAGSDALAAAIGDAVRSLVRGHEDWRVTCVTVLDTSLAAGEDEAEELARSFHTQRLVELRHWAHALDLAQAQLRFHVLHGSDAAACLIDYAHTLHVDHIVMGARGSSGLRRFLGSVSSQVVAQAACSVTVVRARQPAAESPGA